jgi:hypothetical protein
LRAVVGELVERLGAEFDCAEADARVAPRARWMHLTQGENRFSVRLLVKRDQHSKLARIITLVGPGIDLDQTRPVDALARA